MMLKNQRLLGFALVFLSSLGFSLAPTFSNRSYESGANTVGVLIVRFTVAALLMLLIRQFSKGKRVWPQPRLMLQLFLLGAFGYSGAAFFYFTAIENMSSGVSIVIWYIYPVFVVLIGWALFKTKPKRQTIFSLVSAMIGVAITVGQPGNATTKGVILILLSSLSYTFYTLSGSRAFKKTDLYTGVTFVMAGAATAFWMYWLLAPSTTPVLFPQRMSGWLWIGALAIFATVLSTATLFAGLKILGPNTTSVVNTVEPVLNIAAGILFLNEVFSLQQGVGAVFVVGALIYLGVHETRSQPPAVLQ
jgi:drug/metabolite transporter (DMT)-like permease